MADTHSTARTNTMSTNIILLTAEPGCLAGNPHIDGTNLFISTATEPITTSKRFEFDYNLHFCVGIENGGPGPVDLLLFVNCTKDEELPDNRAMLFTTASLKNKELEPFECKATTDGLRKYRIPLTVPAVSRLYISNTCWRNYERICGRIEHAAQESKAQKQVLGKTAGGSDLIAYCYEQDRTSQKPSILVSAGFHPTEPDSLAAIGIMEYMTDKTVRSSMLNAFNVYVIPIMNPDGFIANLQGCNSSHVNFHWKFLNNEAGKCPEADAIMRFCEKITPILYLDFHAYTFQMTKEASPYIKPACFYAGNYTRGLVRSLDEALTKLMAGHAYHTALSYLPTTLPYWLTHKFNTITYAKFHLHLKDGLDSFPRNGREIMKTCVAAMKQARVMNAADVLKRPHGSVSRFDPYLLKGMLLTLFQWHLPLRPLVKLAKLIFPRMR